MTQTIKITATQQSILGMMWEQEMSNKEICSELKMTENGLKYHLKLLYKKADLYDSRNKVGLFKWAFLHGFLKMPV